MIWRPQTQAPNRCGRKSWPQSFDRGHNNQLPAPTAVLAVVVPTANLVTMVVMPSTAVVTVIAVIAVFPIVSIGVFPRTAIISLGRSIVVAITARMVIRVGICSCGGHRA